MVTPGPTVLITECCLQILAVQGPADVAPQVYAKFLFTYVPIFARVSRRLEDLQVGLALSCLTAPTKAGSLAGTYQRVCPEQPVYSPQHAAAMLRLLALAGACWLMP